MLRIVQQSNSAAAKAYYSRSDYLSEGQELVGNWGGKGAAMLGLAGQASKEAFDALCDNVHPKTGERLTARTKQERTTGYDFTFSVPKSVSLLYGLTEDKALLDAFRESVDETMREIEAQMKTRVRSKGQVAERVTGNGIWATFYHFTSRPVDGVADPQMHAHPFMFNVTFDRDENRWKAGQFRDLKRDAPYFQAAFRARLANRLQALGYAIERTKEDDFELSGFSKDVLKRFSRRTAKIEQVAEEKGITDPDKKAQLGKSTREKKNDKMSWQQLQSEWRTRLSDAEQSSIGEIHSRRSGTIVPEHADRLAVDYAMRHCFERNSVVPEAELRAEALRRGLGQVTLDGVEEEFARRRLIVREVDGRLWATSPEVLGQERRLAAIARNGRGTSAALGGFDRKFSRDWLTAQQKQAVRHIWESPDQVMLIRGAAGVGKTTLLKEAVEGIEAHGRAVAVLAPSAEASRGVLRNETGFTNADTVAKFLQDANMQNAVRGGVILIDEASLLGTHALAEVMNKAEALQARLILVGDPRQHASVSRGSAFRLLAEEASLPVIEVTEIQRQSDKYKKAVEDLSAGRTLEGFDKLDAAGWVREIPDGEREQVIARDYLAAISEKKGNEFKTAIVVSPTHTEAEGITAAIRSAMKVAGKLGEEHVFATWSSANLTEAERADPLNYSSGDMLQFYKAAPGRKCGERHVVDDGKPLPLEYAGRFQAYHPDSLLLAVGDRVRVTANGKSTDGHRLNNGSMFTVRGFTPQGDIVVDKGWMIDHSFGHLSHGYVLTSHASQGKTVDKVLIGQSSASGRAASPEQFYVSASRARESVAIYVDDKERVRDMIQGRVPTLTAMELSRQPRDERSRRHRRLALQRRAREIERIHDGRATENKTPEQQREMRNER